MAIEVDTFALSLRSTDTGRRLTANIYFVDGVTDAAGLPRALSISELVMAICLDRAAKLEAGIIGLMDEMSVTPAQLEAMTIIEQDVVDWAGRTKSKSTMPLADSSLPTGAPYEGTSYYDFLVTLNVIGRNVTGVVVNGDADTSSLTYDDFIAAVESAMDSCNSFSQQKMIELQSQTSKRDQAYDMISNILKSVNTVLVGTANNM